jgi:RNA polymerase sigma factor (sigma-70 family)
MSEQEFNQRVLVYSSKFFNYSYKLLGTRDDARDVVQDLFVKLWSLRFNLDHIINIEAFATTILRNLCIDRLKKIKNDSLRSNYFAKLQTGIDYQSNELENDIELRIECVRNALEKLPSIQQKVFIMRDFEEKEFDEISLELNLTPENLRVILSRARKRIREIIENKIQKSDE